MRGCSLRRRLRLAQCRRNMRKSSTNQCRHHHNLHFLMPSFHRSLLPQWQCHYLLQHQAAGEPKTEVRPPPMHGGGLAPCLRHGKEQHFKPPPTILCLKTGVNYYNNVGRRFTLGSISHKDIHFESTLVDTTCPNESHQTSRSARTNFMQRCSSFSSKGCSPIFCWYAMPNQSPSGDNTVSKKSCKA